MSEEVSVRGMEGGIGMAQVGTRGGGGGSE